METRKNKNRRTKRGVYLLHFSKPVHRACHYLGFSSDVWHRISEHREGHTRSPLVRAALERGAYLIVARIWKVQTNQEGRRLERMLKERKRIKCFCPSCTPQPKANPVFRKTEPSGTTYRKR